MFCPNCGARAAENAVFCTDCGNQLLADKHGTGSNEQALRLLMPINVSGLALIAGYLGLFSVLLFPAPIAILFGFLALRDTKLHPKLSGNGRAIFGIVMGILGSVGLLVLLVAILGYGSGV